NHHRNDQRARMTYVAAQAHCLTLRLLLFHVSGHVVGRVARAGRFRAAHGTDSHVGRHRRVDVSADGLRGYRAVPARGADWRSDRHRDAGIAPNAAQRFSVIDSERTLSATIRTVRQSYCLISTKDKKEHLSTAAERARS